MVEGTTYIVPTELRMHELYSFIYQNCTRWYINLNYTTPKQDKINVFQATYKVDSVPDYIHHHFPFLYQITVDGGEDSDVEEDQEWERHHTKQQ